MRPARRLSIGSSTKSCAAGFIKPESKAVFLAEIDKLLPEGADSIILGCTEVGMLLS
jgi:aspartate/glutamate racemase